MLTHLVLLLTLGSTSSSSQPFYFGVSNAAIQVEGSPQDSDWLRWATTPNAQGTSHIRDGSAPLLATQFWQNYDAEYAMAQGAGMNAFRISIAWERVQPTADTWDDAALQHYADMVQAMRARGLEPFITLQHFVLPGWVADHGGLLWQDYPSHFATFAARVAQALAQAPTSVRYFITLNEPNIQVLCGYLDTRYPPGVKDPNAAAQALAQLARAHIAAYNAIADLHADGVRVGYSHNWQVYRPADENPASLQVARTWNQAFNGAFMDAVLTGKFNFVLPQGGSATGSVALPHGPTLDFVGVQNYGRTLLKATDAGYVTVDGPGARNDMGWEVVPDALYHAVAEIAAYGKPVIITETGTADTRDTLRQQYLKDNFAAMQRLHDEGVALFGYLHWSLTDNWEWDSGYVPRFGLVGVDYASHTLTPRPSLQVYSDLIQQTDW